MHISSEFLKILLVASGILLLLSVAGYSLLSIPYSTLEGEKSKTEGIYGILDSGPLPIEDFIVSDSDGRELTLSSQVKDGKLVTYLPDISCRPCAQKGIGLLESVFGGKYKDKMLIISRFEDLRHQRIFQNNFGITSYSIVSENIDFLPEVFDSPVSFYCDSLMVAPHYVTDALSSDTFDAWTFYFRSILYRFEK